MSFYDRANFYPDVSAGYLIKRCHQLGVAVLDRAFAEDGLNASQWSALISILLGNDDMTCATLARDLAHDKGAMTRIIDTLEEKGWVERTRSADDRRVVHLTLTATGEAVTMRCRDKVIDRWNQCFAGWSDDEIARFIAQLQKLRATLEEAATCA